MKLKNIKGLLPEPFALSTACKTLLEVIADRELEIDVDMLYTDVMDIVDVRISSNDAYRLAYQLSKRFPIKVKK